MLGDTTYNPEVDTAMELYNLCKEFNTLPRAGGILDQDSYVVMLLKLVATFVNKKEAQENARARAKTKMKGTR